MRRKLIKLLRDLEKESSFENIYHDSFGLEQFDYEVKEYVNFPNYRTIIKRFNQKYPLPKDGKILQPIYFEGPIKAELKRMELDGFIILDMQKSTQYAYTTNKQEPDYDEANMVELESIILTTKGKSKFGYILYLTKEYSLLAHLLSVIAILISIIAIFYKTKTG